MDRITQSILNEFIESNSLQSLSEDQAFEHFTSFLTVSNHYSESFSTYDVVTGSGSDMGIDAIGIIVNGCLVTEPEEVEDLAETNKYLDVSFVFLQAERTAGFNTQKLGHFGFGVSDFFSTEPSLPQNERSRLKIRITNEIFRKSSFFRRGNPKCYLYYATTGVWTNDQNLQARANAVIHDLKSLNLFREVEFKAVDAQRIQDLYRESRNAVTTEISFPDRTTFPDIPGVQQAYLGLLAATEFLKLIENSNEEILTSLFFDNVRDWQEWNTVNQEIKQTLENSDEKLFFPLRNNGVTIVAKRMIPTGNRLTLEDYQVVNGCQTSYVLHEMRELLASEIMIPVRIIATDNETIKNSIIKATNRQTPVTEDQLFALSEFPKKLEAYFPTFEDRKKLYYERRSRQYASQQVEKVRIINMTSLVRSFAATFLELPHRTTKNYKSLLKTIGSEIFNPKHCLEPYYVSAYSFYKLEYLFRNQVISADLKPARYHLLLGFRLLRKTESLPRFNSNEMKRYCNSMMELLWDDQICNDTFQQGVEIVRQVANGNMDRDNIRTEPFTEEFVRIVKSSNP